MPRTPGACVMTPRLRRLYLTLTALLVAGAVFAAWMSARCTCVLGGADYFASTTSDPSDCARHGAGEE